jgi:hypothetical protein
MAQIDFKDMAITIKDGTAGTPNSITVKIGEGSMSYSEKKPRTYIKDRGNLDTVRDGDEEPVDVSFDATWEKITVGSGVTAGVPSIEDALKARGAAADWVSTSSDVCEPFAVDILCTYTPKCGTDGSGTITLADFRYEDLGHNLKDGTLQIQGKCNITEAIVS